jgi:hypothetical protein
MKPKIHHSDNDDIFIWTSCGISSPNVKVTPYWRETTCKMCLKREPKKGRDDEDGNG